MSQYRCNNEPNHPYPFSDRMSVHGFMVKVRLNKPGACNSVRCSIILCCIRNVHYSEKLTNGSNFYLHDLSIVGFKKKMIVCYHLYFTGFYLHTNKGYIHMEL